MKQMTKKRLYKKKLKIGETAHWEGKYICNCMTRNIRRKLGIKLYGFDCDNTMSEKIE